MAGSSALHPKAPLCKGGLEGCTPNYPINRNSGYRHSSAKSKIKLEIVIVGRGLAPAASLQRLHRRELDVPSYLCFAVIPRSLRRGIRSLAAQGAARCYASQRNGLPRQFANWLAMTEGSRWRDVSDSVLWGSGGFGGRQAPALRSLMIVNSLNRNLTHSNDDTERF